MKNDLIEKYKLKYLRIEGNRDNENSKREKIWRKNDV